MKYYKFVLVLSLFFLCKITIYGQQSVKGNVLGDDGMPLPFANALLLSLEDSKLIKGAVTNENGDYILTNIPKGEYILTVSFTGFTEKSSDPFKLEGNSTFVVPTITLSESMALDEIEIKARKPLYSQKIDRMVINVASSILSAGSTALEVLERSPGILVNRQDNTISLVGKDGVVVMINGKISYMPSSSFVQLLEGMSSDNVESIELITTPPANFDAEGNAGYINIVLKKKVDIGFNGSYSFSGGVGNGTTTSDNISFNYRKNKINIFGNYSFSRRSQGQIFRQARDYLNSNNMPTSISTVSYRDPIQRNHDLRFGIDYQVTDKTIFGVLIAAFDSKWTMDAVNESEQRENSIPTSFVQLINHELHTLKTFTSNVNLNHKFKENVSIDFDLNYLHFNDINPTTYNNSFYDGNNVLVREELTRSDKDTPGNILVSKADYNNQLSDKLNLETGIKAIFSTFENDVIVETSDGQNFIADPELTNKSDLDERTVAAYTSLGYVLSDKTDVKIGLRYEFTDSNLISDTEGKLVDRSYGKLFPTAYISHKINDTLSFGVSYSKRISRPSFRDMAPFVIFLDPTTFFSGNPAIQPAISNNIAFNTNYLSYILKIEYSNENGSIARFTPKIDPVTERLSFQAENIDNTKVFSITLGLPITMANWWKMQNNFTYLKTSIENDFEGSSFKLKQNTFTATTSQSFTLAENLTSEISVNYFGPRTFGFGKSEAVSFMNIGFQKKFSDKWGSLKFNVSDVFESREFIVNTFIPEQNLNTAGKYKFSNRTYSLTYSRNFGNSKVKSSRKRITAGDEELKRVN